MYISISPTEDPNSVCVYLEGKLIADTQDQFEGKFQEAMQKASIIFVDFSALSQLDYPGLNALIRCFHEALSDSIRLFLMHLQLSPKSVIELTETEQIFEILTPKYLSGLV